MAGDPGLGKSQLLQAAASVSPRGIYVCGNATTNAGLTVAVVKDALTGDYAFEAGNNPAHSTHTAMFAANKFGFQQLQEFEPEQDLVFIPKYNELKKSHINIDQFSPIGAMVLADRGLCCIDEFDKMSAEHQVSPYNLRKQEVFITASNAK